MSLYTLRPISDRTPFTGQHTDSPFRGSSWSDTRILLGRELEMLRAQNVVLEVDVRESDLRLDGEIRANARASTPAVRLAFESKQGALTFATDKFVRPYYAGSKFMQSDWQHNVRAIALGLEALRKVDRYGITRRGEQYAGWKAIGAGTAMPASHMTTVAAGAVIAKASGIEEWEGFDRQSIIRRAKANAHPDRNNGDRALWDRVEQAVRVLERAS